MATKKPRPSAKKKKSIPQRQYDASADPERDLFEKLIDLVRENGLIKASCKKLRISHHALYRKRFNDPKYEQRLLDAHQDGIKTLEDVAVTRARSGHSDILLMFLLKGAMPAKYRERHQFSGDPEQPLAPPRLEVIIKGGLPDLIVPKTDEDGH